MTALPLWWRKAIWVKSNLMRWIISVRNLHCCKQPFYENDSKRENYPTFSIVNAHDFYV